MIVATIAWAPAMCHEECQTHFPEYLKRLTRSCNSAHFHRRDKAQRDDVFCSQVKMQDWDLK